MPLLSSAGLYKQSVDQRKAYGLKPTNLLDPGIDNKLPDHSIQFAWRVTYTQYYVVVHT